MNGDYWVCGKDTPLEGCDNESLRLTTGMAQNWLQILLLAVCILAAVAVVGLTIFRDLTTLEFGLFQLLILATGLLGSYIFGRNAARVGAMEVLKPHARAAFRRIMALYNSLYRLSNRIEELSAENPDNRLDLIQALVNEQITTGQDAMEDWRDIVPEDVEEIEKRGQGHEQSR